MRIIQKEAVGMVTWMINVEGGEYEDFEQFYNHGGGTTLLPVKIVLGVYVVFQSVVAFAYQDYKGNHMGSGDINDYLVVVKGKLSFACTPNDLEKECIERGLEVKMEDAIVNFETCTKKIKSITNGLCISMGSRDGSGCTCYLSNDLDACEPYRAYLEVKYANERLLQKYRDIEDGEGDG